MTDLRVVNMWCGPRTVSTALMYSFRQRSDTLVFDEPFYGRYLRRVDPGHPGRDEIIAATSDDLGQILADITRCDDRPVRFIKNIGHHLDAVPVDLLDRFSNALLIRDPARVIASLDRAMLRAPTIEVTGLPQQCRILDHELGAGRTPVVLDSADLLADPPSLLRALCSALDLRYDSAMEAWPPGPKPEDGVWAPHWYEAVHASTGFGPPSPGRTGLQGAEAELLDRCLPLYERLVSHTLVPG